MSRYTRKYENGTYWGEAPRFRWYQRVVVVFRRFAWLNWGKRWLRIGPMTISFVKDPRLEEELVDQLAQAMERNPRNYARKWLHREGP